MSREANNQGFTLIELMLAMAVVSVLLMTVAMTVIHLGNTYNRGVTLKEMNRVSRSVADDLRRTIGATDVIGAGDLVTNSGGGRLCVGSYSYIWNTLQAQEVNDTNLTKFGSPRQNDMIRLVKVPDLAKKYCLRASSSAEFQHKTITGDDMAQAVELVDVGDRAMGVLAFGMQFGPQDDLSGQRLYRVNVRLGAGDTEAMTDDRTACRLENSTLVYCSVEQFSIVIRGGQSG